jgi:hypothetical protein
MVVLDSKSIEDFLFAAPPPQTPPAYAVAARDRPPAFSRRAARLGALPLPLLGRIAAFCVPARPREGDTEAAMLWIATQLRLVSRALYAGASPPQRCTPRAIAHAR